MKIIAHRGNTIGPNPARENDPTYLQEALDLGYDVEVDVWYHDGQLFTGHDGPTYVFDDLAFRRMLPYLWLHCKNAEAIQYLEAHFLRPNFFWHQNDDYTLTSWRYAWTYPNMKPIKKSIAVLPEIFNASRNDLEGFWGVCTDYCIEFDPSQSQ